MPWTWIVKQHQERDPQPCVKGEAVAEINSHSDLSFIVKKINPDMRKFFSKYIDWHLIYVNSVLQKLQLQLANQN